MNLKAYISRAFSGATRRFRLRDAEGGGQYWAGRGVSIADNATIGAWTYIQRGTCIGYGTRIGRYCSIARNVEIGPPHHDYTLLSSHEFLMNRARFAGVPGYGEAPTTPVTRIKRRATNIGDDVWIGVKACVLRGVRVNTGAVIGAHAVVTRDVPPYAIVAGIPARIIGYRFPPDTITAILASQWWRLDPEDLDAFDLSDSAGAAKSILGRAQAPEM